MSVAEIAPRGEGFERHPRTTSPRNSASSADAALEDAISDVIEVIRTQPLPARPAGHARDRLDLYGRGDPPNAITVANEFTRRGEIGRVGVAPYLDTLIAPCRRRRTPATTRGSCASGRSCGGSWRPDTRIVQFGYAGDADADDLVDRAQAEVYAITDHRVTEDYHSLADIMPGALDEIEAIGSRGGAMTGVPPASPTWTPSPTACTRAR